MSKHGKEKQSAAEQSVATAPSTEAVALAVFTETRDLLREIRDELAWLHKKIDDARALG